jgi:DDE superfamily endonuclease
MLRQFAHSVERRAWVHKETPKSKRPIIPQVHSGGLSKMYWSCVSSYEFGPLIGLPGVMNSTTYCVLLESVIAPYIRNLEERSGRSIILMQDNAPCHTAKVVQAKIQSLGLRTFKWPASSPDMNPLENAWAIWKKRRQLMYGSPQNLFDLDQQAQNVWQTFSKEEAKKLAGSFRSRLEEVVLSGGHPIQY